MNQDERDALLVELRVRMANIEASVQQLVTRHEFLPVRMVAYGLVVLVLVTLIPQLVRLVIR
jgi:hypothetical protein